MTVPLEEVGPYSVLLSAPSPAACGHSWNVRDVFGAMLLLPCVGDTTTLEKVL